MNPFQRCSLELEVDDVLDPASPFPHLFATHTPAGARYLIVQVEGDATSGTWVCAPITERALNCVATGMAELRDVISHTATGTVDIVAVSAQGDCTESRQLCRELADEYLPAHGARLEPPPRPPIPPVGAGDTRRLLPARDLARLA